MHDMEVEGTKEGSRDGEREDDQANYVKYKDSIVNPMVSQS